jgi:hypothetical protein
MPDKIILGILEMTGEPVPVAFVALRFSSSLEAELAGKHLMGLHNGVAPLTSIPGVYVGDTNIKVAIKKSGAGRHTCEIMIKSKPGYLTYDYYALSETDVKSLKLFLDVFDAQNYYVFSVAEDETPRLDILNLVKYVVEKKGV